MLDIRRWWPEIKNSDIEAIITYDYYELIILHRLVDKVAGGTEISEDDLLQSVPKNKIGKLRDSLKNLVRRGILSKVPKTKGVIVFRANPGIYTETLKELLYLIRTDNELKKAMIDEQVSFLKVSETLINAHAENYKKNPFCRHLKTEPSKQLSVLNKELGIVIELEFECRSCHQRKHISFEILSPNSIFKESYNWNCVCGNTYTCTPQGIIF